MSVQTFAIAVAFLVPLALVITYYDVRYRRIPNTFVLATLATGLVLNSIGGGLAGALASLGGCLLAFALMFVLHVFGAMGAGDVKLFAAIGSVVGASLVLPTFFVVVLVGGVLGVLTMLRAGSVRTTLHNTLMLLVGLLPGWRMPRLAVPADRRKTIPYGVAITFGSLISLFIFHV
ncbi:MAG: prepilin peptidase CpaA [Acidobacteriota bacterium]|jgi:prepilin peptidase CpaA|nr:prepilin peptidase CpaA [Acidobacteriota bacterium]